MNRIMGMGVVALGVVFTGVAWAQQPAASAKPNVIIILADDLSYGDLGYTGQKLIQTPNIDKMAAEGMRFVEAYSAAPECAPSRAGLMTGRNMGHCRIRGNGVQKLWPGFPKHDDGPLKAEDVTIAQMLKQAGYATGYVGKWGLGVATTSGAPFKKGFDYSYGFFNQTSAHSYYPYSLWENDHEVKIPENQGYRHDVNGNKIKTGVVCYDDQGNFIPPGVADPAKAKNSQALIHAAGLDFIRRNKANPFFLYYATQLPHGPLVAPHLGIYKDRDWPLANKEWAAMVTWLDQCVGEIVGLLKELKLEDNTLILFASDNGYSQWGYFFRKAWEEDPLFKNKGPWPGGKFAVYEGGCRVPMLAYWPKHIRPGESRHLLALYDVMPTLAELAGIASPPTDGISFLPELRGQADRQKKHDYLYWENGGMTTRGQAVRFNQWYVVRPYPKKWQVFDVEKDPACKENLLDQHPELVERAKEMFAKEHVDSDWYTNPNDPDRPPTAQEQARKKGQKGN